MRYTDTENNSNKTFQAFVSEMFSTIEEGARWIPINAADPDQADREMARRRKEEAGARDVHYRTSFHDLPKTLKAKMIKAGSPELSDKEAMAKASVMPGSRRKRGISEEYNKGQQAEKKMIAAGKKHGLLSQGDLSGRGPDTIFHHPNGKNYSMGIKAKGAAAGQIRLHYHPTKGWHFNTGEKPKPKKPIHAMTDEEKHSHKTAVGKWRMGKAIADHLHREGVHHQFAEHLGKPKDHSQKGISKHFAEVVKKKGEPKATFDTESKHRLVSAIRKGMNGDHMVHIMGKGTYSLHPKIAKESGIPYLGDHIDHGDIPSAMSYRGRDKLHNRGQPKRVTVQVNLDHGVIEPTPSHTNIEHHMKELNKKKRKKIMREEHEKRESTKSMIARLVAKRMKKLGQPVPDDIVKDMEPNIHAADPRPTNEVRYYKGKP